MPPKLMHFPIGFSDRHIQGQLVQVNRGEEVSDALILSQAQEVFLAIHRERHRRSEGYEALLILRGGMEGGRHGGKSVDGSR